MDVVKEIDSDQKSVLLQFRDKWCDLALKRPLYVDREKAVSILTSLYEIVDHTPPKEFLFYASLQEAFKAFEQWFPRIGRSVVAWWEYELPMINPKAYGRENSDLVCLAGGRSKNLHGNLIQYESSTGGLGNLITAYILGNMWQLAFPNGDDLYVGEINKIKEEFPSEFDVLDGKMFDDEPGNQFFMVDSLFFAPFNWFVAETICANFCAQVLARRVSEKYLKFLRDFVAHCGIVLPFEKVCVVCDR